jgi:hypothetical protein
MEGPKLRLVYIALLGDLYLRIIMDRYGGPQTTITTPLLGGLYLAIIIDLYGQPQTSVTISLLGGL